MLRMARALVALFLCLNACSGGSAFAHSWYPYDCCSERDCFPLPVGKVKSVQGGWQMEDGAFIAWHEARPSPDGRFHICRREDGKGDLIRLPEKPACFWAPIGAS